VGFGNANRTNGLLSTWSAFQLPPRHRKRGIAAKRHKKRKKKITVLAAPVIPAGADTIDLQGTTRPAEIFALLFVPFCGYSSVPGDPGDPGVTKPRAQLALDSSAIPWHRRKASRSSA
jgi:hypothetical protein